MQIIFPFTIHLDALEVANLETLFEAAKLFQDICNNPSQELHNFFLPEANKCSYNIRNNRKFHVPGCKTKRLQNSFLWQLQIDA